MLEKKIEKKVTEHANEKGWASFKFASPSRSGVPDRIYLRNGETIFVEFKAPGKRPRVLQQAVIELMISKGAKVHVIDDIEKGKQLFNT